MDVSGDLAFGRAVTALQSGSLNEAARTLRSVLNTQPKHTGARNLLAVVLMQLGQFAEAETHLRKALDQQGPSEITYYNYGLVLKALGRATQALQCFTEALKINSSVAETWNNRGTVLNDLNRYEEAVEDFDKAIAINPRYAEALCNKGKSLILLKRFEDAFSTYAKALAFKPDFAEAWLGRANLCLEGKKYQEALEAYRRTLALKPDLAEAYYGKGRALSHLNRYNEALVEFDRALTLKSQLPEGWWERGNSLAKLKRYEDAVAAYDRSLRLKPDFADAWIARGDVCVESKRFNDAVTAYERALALDPKLAHAWLRLGNATYRLKQYQDALGAYDAALKLEPNMVEAWLGRGGVYDGLQRYDEASAAFDRALALNRNFAEAWFGRALLSFKLKRYDEASNAFERAVTLKPDFAEAWLGRGNLEWQLERYDEAFTAFDQALSLAPDLAGAWLGRGNVLLKHHKNLSDTQMAFDRALALKPDLAEAWLGRGNLLNELRKYHDAQIAYDRALALKNDLAEAWLGRANVLVSLKQSAEAVVAYNKALSLKRDLIYARGSRLYARLHLADWTDLSAETTAIVSAVKERKYVIHPLAFSLISSSQPDQLVCAQSFAANVGSFPAIWRGEVYSHDRIRIAYLSGDFQTHPVAQLAVGLFERHDRSRFRTTGISFSPDDGSKLRRRIESAFDDFIDAQQMNDQQIADLIRSHEIDIAVDLMAYTGDNRVSVLARRAAPVQVNYLGYPGTMGAHYIDYIIGDATVIPRENFACYTEQVVWLHDCYQANDEHRVVAERRPTRLECDLPEAAFVFCCFNNSSKILPQIFDVWMRLLAAVDDSVLWLLDTNQMAVQNLRREAESRGISSDRLIFAPKQLPADHLARIGNADLFLDTLPYNAHTTASEALWAGLPLVTCLGSTFPSRVAASLLKAVGLGELITHSLEDYEVLALNLAKEPSRLGSLRERLAHNRTTKPLFDTERFTRNIEAAYATMWQRYQSGQKPQAFDVDGTR
jgi:predicted O-linked N-acetylglucosamine transferase (SPINDLY family)